MKAVTVIIFPRPDVDDQEHVASTLEQLAEQVRDDDCWGSGFFDAQMTDIQIYG